MTGSGASGGTRQRRSRADARRNIERLLAAADAAFVSHGTEASLEGIAREAGVAIGTLYGHFPNRRTLIAALLRERHEALFQFGERLLAYPAADEALVMWIRAVASHAAAYRGLAAVLASGLGNETSELHAACARMAGLGDQLTANARAAGAIRSDVSGSDVVTLTNAAALVREHATEEQADRMIHFTVAGFRPRHGVDPTGTEQLLLHAGHDLPVVARALAAWARIADDHDRLRAAHQPPALAGAVHRLVAYRAGRRATFGDAATPYRVPELAVRQADRVVRPLLALGPAQAW